MERHNLSIDWQAGDSISILPKLIYGFNVIQIKIPKFFFFESDKHPTIHTKMRRCWNSQNNFEKEQILRTNGT